MMPVVLGALFVMSSLAPPSVDALDVNLSAAEIRHGIDRLGVTGRVLYVAAHPDDENTRLLAWLSSEKGVRAGYLSLTRGDGGQNLIGTEQDELLGVIRTEELLAARQIDGAHQFFTRARDFGYSKSADETLAIWGRDEILRDVVRAIRRFKPDLVITRFSTLPPNHGHHTASALLAAEAFRLAGDKSYVTEGDAPFTPARLLHNVSTWSLPKDADMSRYLSLDVGTYDPLSGRSIGEIAARSRSQHKSQGFGAAVERGPLLEYFAPLDGSAPKTDVFSGLDLSWKRFPKTTTLRAALDALASTFDVRAPEKSIAKLARVHQELRALPDENPFKNEKRAEVERLLLACAGLYLDARAAEQSVVPGASLALSLTALARTPTDVRVKNVRFSEEGVSSTEPVAIDARLAPHTPLNRAHTLAVTKRAPLTTPYWLRAPRERGRFVVDDPRQIGLPDGPAPLTATFTVAVGGVTFDVARPVAFTWVDPVSGERSVPVEIVPPVAVTPDRDVVVVPHGTTVRLHVVMRAGMKNAKGTLSLSLPAGWRASPAEHAFALAAVGDEETFSFAVLGPASPAPSSSPLVARAIARVDGETFSVREARVTHAHIRPKTVRDDAAVRLVPVALAKGKPRIGYVPGAGDKVAESLAHVGYDVTILDDDTLASGDLSRFDTIVIGIRAMNARPTLAAQRERLLTFVEKGGRVVVQYQTNSRVGPLSADLFPYPLTIGRGRVTDEGAAMIAVNAAHPMLTTPNALTDTDMQGWVQERGLYFAASWDARYTPIYAMHDDGEPNEEGALLVATHGKGTFVYTGLSFFRQLPAGVPGAYRLMANVLAP
jgi:LmbE family N-acetylglucosaminyl deacetylase